MRTALLLFLVSFLMFGCDARKPPKEIDYDLVYDEIPVYSELNSTPPYNYPILRLLWARLRDGIYDHLWAVIIVSDPSQDRIYDWIDMGARPKGFFDAEVHIKDNLMTIMINRKVITTRNVTYWEDVSNYYKAGVYINRYGDGGEVSVLFEQLHFYDNPDDVVSPHH